MARAPELSLVICTLDEAEAVGGVIAGAQAALGGLFYEIIVVDDSADDATAEAVMAIGARDPRIRLIRRRGGRGLASAAIAGWEAARGTLLAIMDGDGQHEAHLIPALRERLIVEQADFAIASRYAGGRTESGLTGFRDRLSRLGVRLVHLGLGVGSTDPLAGFFVFRRAWFEAVRGRLSGVGFKILADLLAAGERRPLVTEVPTRLLTRAGGVSKLDARVIADLAAQVVEARTRRLVPARFVLFVGVGATGVAVHLAALALAIGPLNAPFWAGQLLAIWMAMTSNFLLNNALTFRDRRLSGLGMVRGLVAFYGACAGGAVMSELLASGLYSAGVPALVAGVGGAASAAAWNYWSASRLAWGGATPAPAAETERVVVEEAPLPGAPRIAKAA